MTAIPVLSCVVEGHGEVQALPILLRRIASGFLDVHALEIPTPFRQPRSRIVKPEELESAVSFTAARVRGRPGGVLIVLDADDDRGCELGPALLRRAEVAASDIAVRVVIAEREYESWFLAAAGSLAGQRGLPSELQNHPSAEQPRDAKGWLSQNMGRAASYSETVDQPAFSATLDLDAARARSRSFDKLVRSVADLLSGPDGDAS